MSEPAFPARLTIDTNVWVKPKSSANGPIARKDHLKQFAIRLTPGNNILWESENISLPSLTLHIAGESDKRSPKLNKYLEKCFKGDPEMNAALDTGRIRRVLIQDETKQTATGGLLATFPGFNTTGHSEEGVANSHAIQAMLKEVSTRSGKN